MAWAAASYSHRQWLTTGDWENTWTRAERKTGATFGVSLLTCLLLLGWCNNKNIHINSFRSYLGIQGRKVKVNICSGPQLYPITDAEYIYRVILRRLQVVPFYTTKLKRRIICKGVSQGHSIFHEAVMKHAPQLRRKKNHSRSMKLHCSSYCLSCFIPKAHTSQAGSPSPFHN